METIRWILGGCMLGGCIWALFSNWMALALSAITHRFHSQVPLVAPETGIVGLLVIPVQVPHWSIYFLPIILDCGTVTFVIWGVTEIYKSCRSKKQIELEEKQCKNVDNGGCR